MKYYKHQEWFTSYKVCKENYSSNEYKIKYLLPNKETAKKMKWRLLHNTYTN